MTNAALRALIEDVLDRMPRKYVFDRPDEVVTSRKADLVFLQDVLPRLLTENETLQQRAEELTKQLSERCDDLAWWKAHAVKLADACTVAESRLTALEALGKQVVERTPRFCGCNDCSFCAAWSAFAAKLQEKKP